MKNRNLRAPLAALPLALLATFSHAQTAPAPSASASAADHGGIDLPDTVVTATRLHTQADQLVSEVVLIDRSVIEASSARTLPELLARSAGLQISATGGAGKAASVFIRGTEARHAILLIDGVRYGSATLGQPTWNAVPLDMIERIEVLKGPASALYGSDGVGGVVHIITRQGREGFHPHAALTLGAKSHRQMSVGLSGGQPGVRYTLGFSQVREQGFSATRAEVPFGNHHPDRDPWQQDALQASVTVDLPAGWRADAGVVYSDGLNHFDDGLGRDTQTAQRSVVARMGLQAQLLPNWHSELRWGQSTDSSNALVGAWLPGRFETRQQQWSWQNTFQTPLGSLLAGLEQRQQKVDSSTAYTVRERDIDAVFVGLQGSQGPHSWQLNLRRDDNSQFGRSNTGFAGYGFHLNPAWRLHVAHGTSFVAPSFNQLYWPGFGNPALQPERGRNTDLGLSWRSAGHELKLVRFDNRIRGFISSTTLPQNVPQVRIDGWTLGYEGRLGAWSWRAGHDLLDPRDQSNGRQLARRARQQSTLDLNYQQENWSVGGSLLRVGGRFDDAAQQRRLAAYTTLDLHAQYRLAQDWSMQLRLNNLGNAVYETAFGYKQPGRGLFMTLRWQPR